MYLLVNKALKCLPIYKHQSIYYYYEYYRFDIEWEKKSLKHPQRDKD